MECWRFDGEFKARLSERLHRQYRLFGPVTGGDGVCRLKPLAPQDDWPRAGLPLIALKKLLLPSRETLWTGDNAQCQSPPTAPATAVVGIAACDLYALDYLDRVFEDDLLYRQRRESFLVVGGSYTSATECFCPEISKPPFFDLFLGDDYVWAGSEAGERLLTELAGSRRTKEDISLPGRVTEGAQRPGGENLEELFGRSADWTLWQNVADRCLSCGACSAVCPTCYCYDVVDEALPGRDPVRRREWDNCFFRSHALVAGGHNFRPGRKERLRFRFEHKMLGFGALRGVPSCVGCGRCKAACPVDIDISEVLAALVEEDAS
ncbi:MAG: 4Fe-4S dicluster domain-containing protein [Desulfuromonadales bacterium]